MPHQQQHLSVALGRWDASVVRLLPRGAGVWAQTSGHVAGYLVGGRSVATVRRHKSWPITWGARIDGFEWRTDDGYKHVEIFLSLPQARRAVERVLAARP